ncbi:MAG: DMT family transporter [Sporomusa sp.]
MKLAYFQLALSMSIVGANVPIGKVIVNELPIFLFSEIRFLIALLFLIPMLLCDNKEIVFVKKTNLLYLFLQAFFGVFLFSIFMLYGVKFTTGTAAGIITSTVPAAIALLSFFILGEKTSRRQISSVGLAVLGISVISFQGSSNGKDNVLLGDLLIIGAVVSEALFTIYAKKLSDVLSPLQMAVGINIIGLLLFSPFAINEALAFNFSKISMSMWLIIVYYSVTASVLSFILWYRGVKNVSASIAGLYTGFMPIVATLVSVIILNEKFGLNHLSGMICVLCAIYFGSKSVCKPTQGT